MPETFKFSLADFKIKPKIKGNSLPWQIAVVILSCTTLFSGYMYYASTIHQPITLNPADESKQASETAAIAYTANAFLSEYMTYAATQMETHQKSLVKWMTTEYADAYKVVWQDKALSQAVQERKVEFFVKTDLPTIIGANEEGRIFVDVTGKIIVKSDITYIESQEKIISGTLTLLKSEHGLKVSNVVWKTAE
jgi:zona occludens toxin (predicted ATPase)